MMGDTSGSDGSHGERRRHLRRRGADRQSIEIRYRQVGEQHAWQTAQTSDIGVGGVFVVAGEPLPIGTSIEVLVWVPTAARAVNATGAVRWTSLTGRTGMGVKFSPLDVESLLVLSAYLATLVADEPDGGVI